MFLRIFFVIPEKTTITWYQAIGHILPVFYHITDYNWIFCPNIKSDSKEDNIYSILWISAVLSSYKDSSSFNCEISGRPLCFSTLGECILMTFDCVYTSSQVTIDVKWKNEILTNYGNQEYQSAIRL